MFLFTIFFPIRIQIIFYFGGALKNQASKSRLLQELVGDSTLLTTYSLIILNAYGHFRSIIVA